MPDQKPKRPSPFCIRLSPDERARLERDAAGMPLAAFIKQCIERYLQSPASRSRSALTEQDRKLLSQLLGWFGTSRIASNINQIAKAINNGTFTTTPEIEADVRNACRAIITIKEILVGMLAREARRR